MIGSPESVPVETRGPDLFEVVIDPDAEPGDVLGALARLLISMAQDGVSIEAEEREELAVLRRPVQGLLQEDVRCENVGKLGGRPTSRRQLEGYSAREL